MKNLRRYLYKLPNVTREESKLLGRPDFIDNYYCVTIGQAVYNIIIQPEDIALNKLP